MGITDIISDFVTALILSYSKELDKKKVSLSLRKSKLEIRDLELYQYALLQHGLPIVIEKGIIESIEIDLPSAINIFKDPIRVNIKNVLIAGQCICAPGMAFPSRKEIFSIREHELDANNVFKSAFYNAFNTFTASAFNDTFLKVFGKLVVTVENIKVNIDFGYNPSKVFLRRLRR